LKVIVLIAKGIKSTAAKATTIPEAQRFLKILPIILSHYWYEYSRITGKSIKRIKRVIEIHLITDNQLIFFQSITVLVLS